MLYVVALPILGETDDTALRRLRAQYHPQDAKLIGPHFTLVFCAGDSREAELRAAVESMTARPFWFQIDRIVRSDLYLYAEPSDGAADLSALHDLLNPIPGSEPFEPHITLGRFRSAAEAEQVARIVGRQNLPMTGRIEELALLRRTGGALDTLASVRLGA